MYVYCKDLDLSWFQFDEQLYCCRAVVVLSLTVNLLSFVSFEGQSGEI